MVKGESQLLLGLEVEKSSINKTLAETRIHTSYDPEWITNQERSVSIKIDENGSD